MHNELLKNWLSSEYLRRRERNPGLSIRAFARFIEVSPSHLSRVLSGKRFLKPTTIQRISLRLGMSPEQSRSFVETFIEKSYERKQKAIEVVDNDVFTCIADRIHFAILTLFETSNYRSNENWIAKRLGFSVVEVRCALNRLFKLGLIQREKNTFSLTSHCLRTTPAEVSRESIRKSHRQVLEHTLHSLDHTPVELRDITSICIAIDPNKLPAAREAIKKFRRSLATLLENGMREEVYYLNVQLVPVTKIKSVRIKKGKSK